MTTPTTQAIIDGYAKLPANRRDMMTMMPADKLGGFVKSDGLQFKH